MAPLHDNGILHLRSPYSVPETLKRLESLLRAKNINVFARIDHSGEAEKVGLKMRPTSRAFPQKAQKANNSSTAVQTLWAIMTVS